MADLIRIQMMDSFTVFVNERQADSMVNKSKKGMALVQFLIMHRGESVSNSRILSTMWTEEKSVNPENALKTMISRLRVTLDSVSQGLGRCIVADRGAYHWQMLPGMTIDLYEIQDLLEKLNEPNISEEEHPALISRLLTLYKGDLLQHSDSNEWAISMAADLHNRYLAAVYGYVDVLKVQENYREITDICRAALDVDTFDDRLHIELMRALINTNRANEALVQYKHVTHLYYRYLGVQPSEDMQEFYKQIVQVGKTIDLNLEAISNELAEGSATRGAFVCEYPVFKELYNLQMRNLERLGSTMFLGVIMVSEATGLTLDSVQQDNIMTKLLDILRNNLRKGDTITRFSPTIFALLLPTVNYTTGNMVMERVKHLFYKMYPNSNMSFTYRIGPLSSTPKANPSHAESQSAL